MELTDDSKGPPQEFHEAFNRLKAIVTEDDARVFQSTTLQDVYKAVFELENMLGDRQALRNLKRIEPLLVGLKGYSKVIEVLCNGTPYLPWIWVCHRFFMKYKLQFALTAYFCRLP
jgi:hypothetical protein